MPRVVIDLRSGVWSVPIATGAGQPVGLVTADEPVVTALAMSYNSLPTLSERRDANPPGNHQVPVCHQNVIAARHAEAGF